MKQRCYISILLFFFTIGLCAQSKQTNSEAIQTFIKQALDTADADIEQAYYLLEQAKTQALNANLNEQYAEVLFEEGVMFFENSKYNEAIKDFLIAAPIFYNNNNKIKSARCYAGIGLCYQYINDFSKSLQMLFKGLHIAKESKDKSAIAAIYNNIGIAYQGINDWENATFYAYESIKIKKQFKDTASLAKSYDNLAEVFFLNKKYSEAIRYYNLAIVMQSQLKRGYEEAISCSNIANVYFQLEKLDSALYYKKRAVEFLQKYKQRYQFGYCFAISTLGSILLKDNKIKEAEKLINDCEECKTQIDDYGYLTNHYTFLYDYYKRKGNYTKALENMELLNSISDSVLLESSNFENQRIAIRYEFREKAHEDSLQYLLKLSNQEIKAISYRNKMYSMLLALIIVVGIALFILYRIRIFHKNKRREALETMRNSIARDLHDEIGSTLSSIQIISSLTLNQSNDSKKVKESVHRILELSNKVSDSIREIVWSVNPIHDKLEAVINHLRKITVDVLSVNNITFTFVEDIKQPEKIISPFIRKNLFMIFKETLNNIRKYSGTELVDIHIWQKEKTLNIIIKDYGCGFDLDKITHGNGLENMQRRATEINAKLDIKSELKNGSLFSLQIPLP